MTEEKAQKVVNEYGKEVWTGITFETKFDINMFHEVDMAPIEEDQQWALHTNLGSLTVLDRMTGFGYRDIETGYRDMCGSFWLASGNYDVRYSGVKTIGDAIDWVKRNANTCVGTETN